MSPDAFIVPALMGGLVAYMSWHMPTRRHWGLLLLGIAAVVLRLIIAMAFKSPGQSSLDALLAPPDWKLLTSLGVLLGIASTLVVRLAIRGKK